MPHRLMSKQLGLLDDALATFLRLDEALPDSPDIPYQARHHADDYVLSLGVPLTRAGYDMYGILCFNSTGGSCAGAQGRYAGLPDLAAARKRARAHRRRHADAAGRAACSTGKRLSAQSVGDSTGCLSVYYSLR